MLFRSKAAVLKTAPEQQEKLFDLIERLSPDKPGVHLSSEGFQPTIVKLNQGVGNDASRPAKLPPGNFYSSSSRDLGDQFKVAVLGLTDGRILWPPKDSGTNTPVCYSIDNEEGSKFGKCALCPNAKLAYNANGCAPQYTFWFIDQELTGIYEVNFSKTSYSAGKALARILKDSRRPWYRWVEFTAEERVNGDKRWFVIKANPVQDAKNAANNDTSSPLREVFDLLNRSLDLETYYPRLARQYDRAAENADPSAGAGASTSAPTKADHSDADFGSSSSLRGL